LTTITAWRITKPEFAAVAFEGKGARLFGGRWNSEGVSMVYTSSTASLAALELLAHLPRTTDLHNFVIFACSFRSGIVQNLDEEKLPPKWRESPAPRELQEVGDKWVQANGSAVLRVPSVIIDSEWNYLLNPAHKDFASIEVADPAPFNLDLRLMRR
jgi:RES domain-containing protein